jgi:N-acetyl-gamma-glutamyl-phosphate reductase
MIKAGIIGAAGYTGGEILRLLLLHPEITVQFVHSESQCGKYVYEIHKDCYGLSDLKFIDTLEEADIIFLCKDHGKSRRFLDSVKLNAKTKIIDLSQDFRHNTNNTFRGKEFIYGLPELNKEKIKRAHYIANPGCFATCIQLALLPLAAANSINSDIHVSATTGSTGAGQNFSETTHHSRRNNNHSAYKPLNHQHNTEIVQSLKQLQNSFSQHLNFVPQRGSFTRGIYSVSYIKGNYELEKVKNDYLDYYSKENFTHVVPFEADVKQVVNTNNCFISLQQEGEHLIIISAIDNLLKGAAGQAVHNMNLLFGLEETAGLKLKPSSF